jgi:predicted DNA-binding protein (MmcQ/YjbR family)
MNIDWIREICLSFPHTAEQIQWGDDLVFKVAGKIHAVAVLKPAKVWLSFKTSPEKFAELTERPGIIPAPYLARAKWIALETKDALPLDELAGLLRESYDMVLRSCRRKPAKASCAPSIRGVSHPQRLHGKSAAHGYGGSKRKALATKGGLLISIDF